MNNFNLVFCTLSLLAWSLHASVEVDWKKIESGAFARQKIIISMSGLKQRKNANHYQDGNEPDVPNNTPASALPPDVKDPEDEDDDKKEKLTLMEECLLLGLKDNQVQYIQFIPRYLVFERKFRERFLFGTTIFPMFYEDVYSLSYLYVVVLESRESIVKNPFKIDLLKSLMIVPLVKYCWMKHFDI
jgi:hypothetical protein